MATAKAPTRGSWKVLYQVALIENDRSKLTELVAAIETAIVHRRKELTGSVADVSESADMVLAAEAILKIKTETLGWPSVGPSVKRNQSLSDFDRLQRVESIHHWHPGKK
jgi:hypothetical protein